MLSERKFFQLLKKRASEGRGFKIDKRGLIRERYTRLCPVCAVYRMLKPDEAFFGNARFSWAGQAIGLLSPVCYEIAYVADGSMNSPQRKSARMRLLKALGLKETLKQ